MKIRNLAARLAAAVLLLPTLVDVGLAQQPHGPTRIESDRDRVSRINERQRADGFEGPQAPDPPAQLRAEDDRAKYKLETPARLHDRGGRHMPPPNR